MNGHRWTTLAALILMVATVATGCDFGSGQTPTPNLCTTDADCVDGGVCDPATFKCVECLLDGDCPLGKKCDGEAHQCVGCLADADCAGDLVCDSALNLCVECLEDADCGDGGHCDEAMNVCIECVDDADCVYPEAACAFSACIDGECVTGTVPDGLPCSDGDPCTLDDQCEDGECVGGVTDPNCIPTGCEGDPDGTPCDDGDECTLDDFCLAGVCVGGALDPECAEQDLDGDGFTPAEGDCDDTDAEINPAAVEICGDNKDNDCNGMIDDGCGVECFPTGCSGEICASEEMDSDCQWLPEYECLKLSVCGNFGPDGGCAWLETDAYLECLNGLCLPEEICGNGLDDDCNGIVDDGCMTGCESDADCPLGETCEIYCGNGWCEGVCVPGNPENLCEEAGGECIPIYWDEPGDEWGWCPDGMAEVDLPGCGDDAICCFKSDPPLCESAADCDDGDECTFDYCMNGQCVYEDNPDCNPDWCWSDWMCGDGQYCNFPGCYAETGTCVDIPDACAMYYSPVCGCDGVTYSNICFLQAASQSLAYEGACDGPLDKDGDGWTSEEGDCDDTDSSIHPGAQEVCYDGLDNNCDGMVDEGCGTTECQDLTGVDFGPCDMFMGWGFQNGACVGISGCGCPDGDTCGVFGTKDACEAACLDDNPCVDAGGFCSLISEDGTFDGCPPGSAEVDLGGCDGGTVCCMPFEPPECSDVCDCYDIYGDEFSQPCPLLCMGCGNFWACEAGSCVEHCGFIPEEVYECMPVCLPYEICGDNIDNDCDGEIDEDCGQPCGPFPGLPGCADDEFCLFPDGTCDMDGGMGICTPYPNICPLLWAPVCGCDGETYPNECSMWVSGVSKDYDGACDEPVECYTDADCAVWDPCVKAYCEDGQCVYVEIPNCGNQYCWGNDMCLAGQFCNFPGCAVETGICTDIPEICPYLWAPVCGCDGNTYANECIAFSSSISVAYEGECDADCVPEGEGFSTFDPSIQGCCEGLTAIQEAWYDEETGMCGGVGNAFVCTYCGNGLCGLGENICNCPEDCSGGSDECKALDPLGYGPCAMVLGFAWNGEDCAIFSGCSCYDDCDQFYPTYDACMDVCKPNPYECIEIDPYAYGMCEMLMGVGFDGEDCVYISGCGCGSDPAMPSCDGIFETMNECTIACLGYGYGEDGDGF